MSVELPEQLETAALIEHIEARYHAAHRRDAPELVRLAKRVDAAAQEGAPRGLVRLLERFAKALDTHMEKEEAIVFPFMRRGGGAMIVGPIGLMRADHDEHMAWIGKVAALTGGFRPPEGAAPDLVALYGGLQQFVGDLTEHIRIENDVLFRRFSG